MIAIDHHEQFFDLAATLISMQSTESIRLTAPGLPDGLE
jgi:hypothetical protein